MSATPAVARPRELVRRLWLRACRVNLSRRRVTRERLHDFVATYATHAPTLVVHSHDVDHRRLFPNATTVSSRPHEPADLHTDRAYGALATLPSASEDLVVCTGLLEHVPEPQQLLAEVHRILRPGGRLLASASAVFPVHGAPHDYQHFTSHGLRRLASDFADVEVLRGSTGPYTTVGVLLQRINLQCDVLPPVRVLNEVLMRLLPLLDRAVLRQYDTLASRDEVAHGDTAMPATLFLTARR